MKKALICFTRVPRAGKTKTRLLPILSGDQCAQLHWAFLRDLAAVYDQVDADLFVAYTQDPEWESLKDIFPRAKDIFPQAGVDLGEKMHRAICTVLEKGYEAVVLTGTDLPNLTAEHLKSGFDALERSDIAIGPTSDGGYYLIGMKSPHPEVFHVQGYGGSTALENTLAAAADFRVSLVMICDDVDTPEDLRALTVAPESHTGRCLAQFKEEGVTL